MALKEFKKKTVVAAIPPIPILKSLSPEDRVALQKWCQGVAENIQVMRKGTGRGGVRDKVITIDDMLKLGYTLDQFDY
jgi:hypothetical protein